MTSWRNWKKRFQVTDLETTKDTQRPPIDKRFKNWESPPGTAPHSNSCSVGSHAEKLAVGWLKLNGFQILKTNVRTIHAQVDILAKKDKLLYVVEVKGRHHFSSSVMVKSLGRSQKLRLQRAGFYFWRRRDDFGCRSVTGLLILVDANREVHVLPWQLAVDSS